MTSEFTEPPGDQDPDSNDDRAIFASSLIDQVNKEDIGSMVYIQRDMLSRFEKTNEMLINFNILSTGRYEATAKEFQKHTQLVYDMKKDLDSIFKRIRVLKQRLEKTYPEAFAACSAVYNVASDEDEEAEDSSDEEVVVRTPRDGELPEMKDMATSMTQPKQDPPLVTVTEPRSPKNKTPPVKPVCDPDEKS